MSQRIRYATISEGVLLSRRNFITATGKTVQVELDLNNKKYRVIDSITNEVVTAGGRTKNLAVLKIQSKRALSELGVVFTEETRDRGGDALNEDARVTYSAANRGE